MAVVQSGGIRILDSDFAFIASSAAVELDNFIKGESKDEDFPAVVEFANLLKNTTTESHDVQVEYSFPVKRGLMDPASAEVFSMAVAASFNKHLKSNEIAEEVVRIAGLLDSRMSCLEEIRDFCTALSRCAIVYRQRIYRDSARRSYYK